MRLIRKLNDNKGSLDSSLTGILLAFVIFMITYQMLFAQPFFSDRRITEDYVELSRDLICRQSNKLQAVNDFLIGKLTYIQGQKDRDYILRYYVQKSEDNWTNSVDITSQIGSYPLKRGDLLIVYFKKIGASPFEKIIKKELGTVIIKTGMIEADM